MTRALPPIEYLDTVDSTHGIARARALEGCSHGWGIHADTQTAGRGRQGRAWRSSPNANVHLSVLLRDALDPARGATLPLAVGVAVARVLDPDRTHGVRLKWPNDLWLQDRKLGGILCERVDGGPTHGVALLVGVGVNIAYAPSELPEATAPAICLREVAPDAPGPRAWAEPLRDAIVAMADRLARDGAHAWRAEWDARDLTVGRDVTFRAADGERHGRVERVADDGALHVRGPDGVLHRVIAGEVRFRSRG